MTDEKKPAAKKKAEGAPKSAAKPKSGAKPKVKSAGAAKAHAKPKAKPAGAAKAHAKPKTATAAPAKPAASQGVPGPRAGGPKRPKAPRPRVEGEAVAIARFVRMAPRKLRLVMDAIRGKSLVQARSILRFAGKRACGPLAKVLNSAVANAENNSKMNPDALYVSRAFVDQGPTIKRFIPRAMGRASSIRKKTSHITIAVREREGA